jgi:sulfite reductase (NADPH) flavoprotein alpha-component
MAVFNGAPSLFHLRCLLFLPEQPVESHDLLSHIDAAGLPAATILQAIASMSANSSELYIYDDVLESTGFGEHAVAWSTSKLHGTAPIVNAQTRAGAGIGLVGRLSGRISKEKSALTAFTTITGLSMMAPALRQLPAPSGLDRLVLHIPAATFLQERSTFISSLYPLASVMSALPQDLVILVSALPQETVDFTNIAYSISAHVIHLFDYCSFSRETGHRLKTFSNQEQTKKGVSTAIIEAGYSFFRYEGNPSATTAIVVLNSTLARGIATLANQTGQFGVVIVSVVRPWHDSALRAVIPSTIKILHVLDEVYSATDQGFLSYDVLVSIHRSQPSISVRPHKVTPVQSETFQASIYPLIDFVSMITSTNLSPPIYPQKLQNALFFASAQSPKQHAALAIQRTFAHQHTIDVRVRTEFDITSKPGGIAATALVLGPKGIAQDIPLTYLIRDAETTFLGILDQTLLKSHDLFRNCKPGSSIFIDSTWSSDDLLSNIPRSSLEIIKARSLRLFTTNIQETVSSSSISEKIFSPDELQNFAVQLIFVRLYLGKAARENLVWELCAPKGKPGVETDLIKINARVWSTLEEIDLSLASMETMKEGHLKHFVSNALIPQENKVARPVPRLTSWHEAARHLLFPDAYSLPPITTDSEPYSQNSYLRPEVPERTYLVTCTVNRRLTPKEYDRNVFHVEFDTTGTGLRYAIGEALGVYGWNDEQEVLEFCSWYDVDPNYLISIPVVAGEEREHTRTVFQALQQQIDIFGRPPRSFYTDLAQYATNSVDKHALLFIGSAEGSSTFKVMAERDTVTFADVLGMYPSAKPGIEILCQMIGDIKPRHYSIASAQSVVGNRVDLLVVTVEWLVPCGKSTILSLS